MAYVPDDPVWNLTVNRWYNKKATCKRCGVEYFLIDNIGSWQCKQKMLDVVNDQCRTYPADHTDKDGTLYSDADDITVPITVARHLQGRYNPRAIVEEMQQRRDANGVLQPYAAIKLRRYDRREWERIYYGYVDRHVPRYNRK